jgi:ComF family protein
LKFGGALQWVPPLVEVLENALTDAMRDSVDVIVPVPLHRRRLRQRGFNQSALLARELGKRLGVPVRCDLLARKLWTEPQTRLNREERLRNVRDAFRVLKLDEAGGMRILLIDDVFTTGTTLGECTQELKRADASEVHALTVSRSLPDWKPDF